MEKAISPTFLSPSSFPSATAASKLSIHCFINNLRERPGFLPARVLPPLARSPDGPMLPCPSGNQGADGRETFQDEAEGCERKCFPLESRSNSRPTHAFEGIKRARALRKVNGLALV